MIRRIFTFIFIIITITGFSQSNPMFANNDSAETKTTITKTENLKPDNKKTSSSSIKRAFNKLLRANNKNQTSLRNKIAEYSDKIKEESNTSSYIWILLISFVYGIAHSLGPGHNKILVFSYFIGEKAKIKQGLILGNLLAFIHALSGLIISLIFIYIIKKSVGLHYDNSDIDLYIQKFSFAMISIIGLILLISHLRNYFKKDNEESSLISNKRIFATAFALGVIPCPSTMILVSFLSIAGLTYFAPIAALFMALGMAFTISLIGIITIMSRNTILRIFRYNNSLLHNIQFIMAISGSLLIILLGVVFLIG